MPKFFDTTPYADKAVLAAGDLLAVGDSAALTGGVPDNKTSTLTGLAAFVAANAVTLSGTAGVLTATAANLTISTVTSGTLAVTSAGALNLTQAAASTWTVVTSLGLSGGTLNFNASSNFATNINTGTSTGAVTIGNSAAGIVTLANKANTAATFLVTDGTNAHYTLDTRTGITGVTTHTFAGTAASFASAAGNAYSRVGVSAFTLTQTGTTTVTALAGLSLLIGSPTVTDASALTVTTASAVQINGPLPAGSVTFTNSYALDIPTFVTNGTRASGLRVFEPSGAGTNTALALSTATGYVGLTCNGAGRFDVTVNDTLSMLLDGSGNLNIPSASQYQWGTLGVSADTSVKRLAAAVVGASNASTGAGWFQNTSGSSRVTTTNITNVTTTPAAITGLSFTTIAGRKYAGRIKIWCVETTAADGYIFDLDGGAGTWTSFRATYRVYDTLSATAALNSANVTAIATDFTGATLTGEAYVEIDFAGVANAAGTFIPRFAKASDAAGATFTAYINSFMLVEDVP